MNSKSIVAALVLFLVPTFMTTAFARCNRRRAVRRRAGLFLSVGRGKIETMEATWGMRLFVRKERDEEGNKTETLEARGPLRLAKSLYLVKDVELGLDKVEVDVNGETKERLVVTSISAALYKRDKESDAGITEVGSLDLTVSLETIEDKEVPRVSGSATVSDETVELTDGKIRFDGFLYQKAFGEYTADAGDEADTGDDTDCGDNGDGDTEVEEELTGAVEEM